MEWKFIFYIIKSLHCLFIAHPVIPITFSYVLRWCDLWNLRLYGGLTRFDTKYRKYKRHKIRETKFEKRQTCLLHWRFPTSASVIVRWKTLRTFQALLKAGCRTEPEHWIKGSWSETWTIAGFSLLKAKLHRSRVQLRKFQKGQTLTCSQLCDDPRVVQQEPWLELNQSSLKQRRSPSALTDLQRMCREECQNILKSWCSKTTDSKYFNPEPSSGSEYSYSCIILLFPHWIKLQKTNKQKTDILFRRNSITIKDHDW